MYSNIFYIDRVEKVLEEKVESPPVEAMRANENNSFLKGSLMLEVGPNSTRTPLSKDTVVNNFTTIQSL